MPPKKVGSSSGTRKRQRPFFKKTFLSTSNQKYYEETVNKAQMIEERPVFMLPGEDLWGIGAALAERKWSEVLCKPMEPGCANLVTEFYANAQFDATVPAPSSPTFSSYLRGKHINYSAGTIRRFLQLPYPHEEAGMLGFDKPTFHTLLRNYPRKEVLETLAVPGTIWKDRKGENEVEGKMTPSYILRHFVKPEVSVWCQFVMDTIIPSSNKAEIHPEAALCIFCLMKGYPIDVAKIISWRIHDTVNVKKKKTSLRLAYPNLLTTFLHAQHKWKVRSIKAEVKLHPSLTLAGAQKLYVEQCLERLKDIKDPRALNEGTAPVPRSKATSRSREVLDDGAGGSIL